MRFLVVPENRSKPNGHTISPSSGPAHGGTAVKIHGENLGCITGVFFGKVVVEKFSNSQAALDCGASRVT